MTQPAHRNDPTRHEPGGSRTETKISQESELGSDNAAPPQPGRAGGPSNRQPKRSSTDDVC